MTTKIASHAEAWGIEHGSHSNSRCRAVAAIVSLGPPLAVALVGYALFGLPGLLPAALALLIVFLILRTSTTALVSSLDPQPARDQRLQNIVTGLTGDLGIRAPEAYTVRGPGRNGLVFWYRGRPALGLTAEAVSGYARTELEAVVAHLLARLDRTSGGLDRTSLRLGGILGPCAQGVTIAEDARAAAITRYPPALAKAIEKARPAAGRFSHLWFVGERPGHPSPEARAAALSDL